MSNADFWESESARRPWFDPQAQGDRSTPTGADREAQRSPAPTSSHHLSEAGFESDFEAAANELRDLATRLVPLEGALGYLAALREPAPMEVRVQQEPEPAAPSAASYLEAIDRLHLDSDSSHRQQQLRSLHSALRLKQRSVEALFAHLVYPSLGDRGELDALVNQMRDRSLRAEAQMQRQAIAALCDRLPSPSPQATARSGDLDPLHDDTQAIIGVLLDIERRQRVLERLVLGDRTLPAASLVISLVYVLVAVTMTVLFVIFWSDGLLVSELGDRKLPLIGIPWPVLVWSLFGSLAAIVARCVYRPLRRFGETVQWLLLRPVQGVVLGGATYLILESLLLLLTRQFDAETPSAIADEAILLLSFLVGSSDRFGEAVFRWISEPDES